MNQLKALPNLTTQFNKEIGSTELIDKIVRSARVFYLSALLIFILLLQTSHATFINISMLLPVYGLLSFSFLLNSLYLFYSEKIKDKDFADGAMFAADAVFIAGMNFFANGNYSIFLILFLFNIILCGLKYKAEGSVLLAVWTSVLFSLLLVFGPQLEGSNLYIGLVLNNFSFFSVAYLGGYLSHQLEVLNFEVATKTKDIETLQHLNELIISNVANGLLALDQNLRITQCNSAAENIFSTKLDGKLLKEILFHDFQKIQPHFMDVNKGISKRLEFNLKINQAEKNIEFIISKIKGVEGGQSGYVILLQDTTQLKALETKLRQKDKLAAVGQLAAGIAHEIRNPLASISGSIQLLADGKEMDSSDNKKLMNITVKEIDRLNELIAEFLDYVKTEPQSDEVIDLNLILKDLLTGVALDKRLNPNIKQDISLNAQKMIQGNSNKLKQSFLNIIINAYQAMPDLDFGSVKIRSWDQANSVLISIEDQGVGISEENLDKIFEPFHTTKTKGSGLGLAISHKILESHGASVHVESEIGKGTVFTIEFTSSNNPIGSEMKIKKHA